MSAYREPGRTDIAQEMRMEPEPEKKQSIWTKRWNMDSWWLFLLALAVCYYAWHKVVTYH